MYGISINRLVPLLVPLFWKNPTELDVTRFPDLISESGPPCQRFSRKNTHKTIRDVPVHTAVRPQTVTGGVMLRSLPLSCSAAAPSHQIDLTHSFLGVLRSWRALYPRKGPFAHDARKTSRCWGLWGPFWVPFRLRSPPRDNSEMCSRGVSWPDLVDSDGFYRSPTVRDP